MLDVPKLLGDGVNLFVDGLKDGINNLNPLNARPEWREYFDDKYGLDSHKFGFFEYYTLKE